MLANKQTIPYNTKKTYAAINHSKNNPKTNNKKSFPIIKKNILYAYFIDSDTPKKTYQTIQLENNYKIIFNQWGLYVIKNKKNIKGDGIPFIQPKKKLTINAIQSFLNQDHLWPPGHSLKAATTKNKSTQNSKKSYTINKQ